MALVESLAGTALSGAINMYSQHRANAVNREASREAFERQRDAVQRQNEYNSPSMQVARMMAAGLSPSLAYGASGDVVGNQTEVPEYSPIPAEVGQVGDFGAAFREGVGTEMDIRKQMMSEDLAVAEIASRDAQTFLAYTQGYLNEAQEKRTLELLGYEIESYEAENTLTWDRVLNIREQTENLKFERSEIQSRTNLNEAQISELAARVGVEEAEAYAILAKLPHEIFQMDANAAYSYAASAECREKIVNLANERFDMAFYRNMADRKFDFEKQSWKNEQDKWIAEYKQSRADHFADNVTKILTVGLGAAAMSHGQSSFIPSKGYYNPSGYGKAPVHVDKGSDFKPATGRYHHR